MDAAGLCLSMHQPWASLLVYGLKRIEGRGWPTEHRGRLWIAATAKTPTPEEVEAMEVFYRSMHDDSSSLHFPPAYPTGVLLGCVEVVGCLTAEQVEAWEALPPGLHAEVGSPHCFLCQAPQRLVVPQQVRGWPKLWPLEKKLLKVAQLGLKPAPNGQDFSWAAFGPPPAITANLPPSANRTKYAELQKKLDAGRGGAPGVEEPTTAAAGGGGGSGSSKVARGEECQSPRATTTAAAGLPRAVALQSRQRPAESGAAPNRQPPTTTQQEREEQQLPEQEQDPGKRLRAVRKKLRAIEALEGRLAAGQALSPKEMTKVQQRQQMEGEAAELEALVAKQ